MTSRVDPDSLHDLIREVDHDHCRAMFDAWAPALQGLDLARAAQKLGALTVHTTVANYSVRPQFRYLPSVVNYEKLPPRAQAVPMHEGFIDYGAFLKTMTESGFQWHRGLRNVFASPRRSDAGESGPPRGELSGLHENSLRSGPPQRRNF